MAQAFIKHVLTNGNTHLEQQIRELRDKNKDEFSDCNEDLLVKAADEVEQAYYSKTKKRKRKVYEDIKSKRAKLDTSFTCDFCDRVYKHKRTLNRHLQSHLTTNECTKCNATFTRKSTLKKHSEKCGTPKAKRSKQKHTSSNSEMKNEGHTCNHCGIPCSDYDSLFHHVSTHHPLSQTGGHKEITSVQGSQESTKDNEEPKSNTKRNIFRKHALNKTVNETSIIPHANEKYDLLPFLANVKEDVKDELILRREKQRNVKWYVNARVEMVRAVGEGNDNKAHPHFRSKNYISLLNENNDHNLNEAFQSVNKAMEEFISKGSDWILNKVMS